MNKKSTKPKTPKKTKVTNSCNKRFGNQEVKALIREVILGSSRGESVRSICRNLSVGDRTRCDRLARKYKTVCDKQPQLIAATVASLSREGYLVKNPLEIKAAARITVKPTTIIGKTMYKSKSLSPQISKTLAKKLAPTTSNNILTLPVRKHITDSDITGLFMGLVRLIKERAVEENQNQVQLLREEITRLKSDNAKKETSNK
jgi:hypothetical protein